FVSSSLLPSIQVLLMDAAHGAPALGGAIVHSAFNIGNALGAALGGSVVALGLGFRSPTFVAAVTTLIAFVMFVVMRRRAGYKKAA
ncbi:MAG: MFS transporter, partial [Canibacter sp.]